MSKICVITGLTATGKSKMAIDIAQACNGIILSADSVAVYKELPIASAAVLPHEQMGITHYGIGIVSVKDTMDVATYQKYALDIIQEAFSKGQNVVLVGGSGLYLNAVLYDYQFTPAITLKDNYDDMDNITLHTLMNERDSKLSETIHVNNRKRMLRALRLMDEVNMTKTEHVQKQSKQLRFKTKIIACDFKNRDVHRQRMNDRVDMMMVQGLKEEVLNASLLADFNQSSMSAIGVKQWERVFNKEISDEVCVQLIKTRTHQFAKRQRTWFKHQIPCEWIYVDDPQSVVLKKDECIQWMNSFQE